MHYIMSSPLFLIIITIGEAQGDVDGWIILAINNPFIVPANLSQNLGATGLTRCAIGFATPTSISQTYPSAAGGKVVSFPINKRRFFQM